MPLVVSWAVLAAIDSIEELVSSGVAEEVLDEAPEVPVGEAPVTGLLVCEPPVSVEEHLLSNDVSSYIRP